MRRTNFCVTRKKKYFKEKTKSESLTEFFNRHKPKGIAKKIRQILDRDPSAERIKKKVVENFILTAGLVKSNEVFEKNILTSWTNGLLPSDIRMFLFKWYSNKLITNAKASHFNENINAGCDFCTLNLILPAPKETYSHLFWDCSVSQTLITKCMGDFLAGRAVSKNFFFTGTDADTLEPSPIEQRTYLTIFDIIRFVIWETKWQKKKFNTSEFASRFGFYIRSHLIADKKFKNACNNYNILTFRRDE
jgi:hypothetical protein